MHVLECEVDEEELETTVGIPMVPLHDPDEYVVGEVRSGAVQRGLPTGLMPISTLGTLKLRWN